MRLETFFFVLLLASASAAEPELAGLERFPAVEPNDAFKTFVVREGFKVELVASEPNVASPVAGCFDENGRMYVVEMRDYSEHRDEKLGRIRLLEDADGDGVFEKSTIFAEGLAWPTAVICYGGGIFVGATPDILFLRDTNGDGRADERRVVFTGFGAGQPRLNVQQLINSFQWGLDNRIHGANGGNGGTIQQVGSSAPELKLGSRDFSFDPKTLVMRAETGGGQHGMSFDDFGRKFVSNNSSHIRMQVFEDRYLQGVTGVSLPPGMVDIAREGPAAEVFRISPEEPWRKVRTQWRVAGEVPGPIEGGGRASGYFTGATGVTIYRGDAYPPEFRGNAFVGDAGGNLVHRKIIEPAGVLFEAHRAPDELNREFLASRDTWFRPVQFLNAPDGCLYVIDMYREVIEHPWSLPPNLKKHIDLDSGRERGRIWRIAPANFKAPKIPMLGKLAPAELVSFLDHPNAWQRETAERLMFERQDKRVASGIQKIAQSPRPASRVTALAALQGLDAASVADVRAVGKDSGNALERALVAVESLGRLKQRNLLIDLPSIATSTNARVRFQLAWTISATQPPNTPELLADILRTDASEPYIRAAVLVATQDRGDALFKLLVNDSGFLTRPGAVDVLSSLAAKAPRSILEQAVENLNGIRQLSARFDLAAALLVATKTGAGNLANAFEPVITQARESLSQSRSGDEQIAAVHLLRSDLASRPLLQSAFTDGRVEAVQIEAFRALASRPREAASLLFARWNELPARVRQSALDIVLNRGEGAALTIDALRGGKISRRDLTASQSQTLRQHSNPAVSRPALELLGSVDADRAAVIDKFRPALQMKGDVLAGEKIFTERCAACHRVSGQGVAVGPDLESVRGNGREYILTHLLDPNREVNARYVVYVAELKNGESVSGILARETDSEVTLRMANAQETTLQRANIKRLTASPQSLMPVGLEEGLNQEAMASLLEFVMRR